MSIGFIGSTSSNKRTVDVFSGNAGRQIDVSLQNVLGKYDQIKVDLDRLVDNARLGTYDITSRQNYNAYNKDALNGWAENWYSEYRAVLALRADGLQKKLQAAYNRVLERSAYAEVKADQESIFAPYANRTINGADVTYREPVSKALIGDINAPNIVLSTAAPPTTAPLFSIADRVNGTNGAPPADAVRGTDSSPEATRQRQATIQAINDYLAATPQVETAQEIDDITTAAIQTANQTMGVGPPPPPGTPTPPAGIPASSADAFPPYGSGLIVGNSGNVTGYDVVPPPATTTGTEVWQNPAHGNRWEERTFTEGPPGVGLGYYPNDVKINGGYSGQPVYSSGDGYPSNAGEDAAATANGLTYVPLNNAAHTGAKGYPFPASYYINGWNDNDARFDGWLLPRSGVTYAEISAPGSPSASFNSPPTPGTWQDANGIYTSVRKGLEQQFGASTPAPTGTLGPGSTNPAGSTAPPPTGGAYTQYNQAYDTSVPGDVRKIVPEFAVGDIIKDLDPSIRDVLLANADALSSIQSGLANVSQYLEQSFIGRQFDDILGGNQYEAKPMAFSAMVYPMINAYAPDVYLGPVEDVTNSTTGGSFIEVGSGTGLGSGLSNAFGFNLGPDLHFGHLSAISGVGGFPVVPNIGLAGGHFTIPIPIPFVGTLNLTFVINASYDLMSDMMKQFFDAIKKPIVETLQTQAYAASGGTAFDSYASRGEYHATDAGFDSAFDGMNIKLMGLIPLPIGSFVKQVMNYISGDAGETNGVSEKDSLLGYKHAVQGAESRETETGAFFATNAFLSQFEMKDMASEYWVGTQQNEEVANMDLVRAMQTAGSEFLMVAVDALVAATAAASAGESTAAKIAKAAVVAAVKAYAEGAAAETMTELLFGDHNEKGSILNGFGKASTYKAEGYNYLEPDHKPFEGDSDFNYKPDTSGLASVASFFGAFDPPIPDTVLEGYSNTRRYRKMNAAGNTIENITLSDVQNLTDPYSTDGLGARAYAGNESLTSDSDSGIWNDTALGDINEVYVGTRKIKFTDLSSGFGEFSTTTENVGESNLILTKNITDTGAANAQSFNGLLGGVNNSVRTVQSSLKRYTGSDTREYGRRYDTANPINFETFNSGMYSGLTNQGGTAHYDRRNDYNLSFTTKADSTNTFSLFGSQALNPTIGGFIKMQEIDKNKYDTALLKYENIDYKTQQESTTGTANRVANMGAKDTNNQYFGAAADESLNEVNQILYEALHLRADGRNLSEVKEYRDVFETGLMNNIFISGQAYHPSGGGITSSIEIKYDSAAGKRDVQNGTSGGQDIDTREYFNTASVEYDPYNTPFLNKSRGKATIYLDNYFAFKKRASNKTT